MYYYEENKYKAAKAVGDKMWKTYKLFGYDIQAGWTYNFTKTGRFQFELIDRLFDRFFYYKYFILLEIIGRIG